MNSQMMAWLAWLAWANGRAREAERRGIAERDLPDDPLAPRPRAILAAAAGVAAVAVLLLLGAIVLVAAAFA
jgi:hypothetical protein